MYMYVGVGAATAAPFRVECEGEVERAAVRFEELLEIVGLHVQELGLAYRLEGAVWHMHLQRGRGEGRIVIDGRLTAIARRGGVCCGGCCIICRFWAARPRHVELLQKQVLEAFELTVVV